MRFSDKEVIARQPIWAAMSELYLDNDDRPFDSVATICAKSAFSLDELERILFEDVHPVLSPNLSPVGLEWDGFDQAWLIERIQVGSPSLLLRRAPFQKWIRRWVFPWRDLRGRIVALRDAWQNNAAP